jgi:hypothetical protein
MSGGQKRWGKRSINAQVEIDGFKLRWELRSEPQLSTEHGHEGVSLSVQRVDGSFRELILEYPIATQERFGMTMPKYFPQRPKLSAKLVEADIRKAMTGGWNPETRGKPFIFQVPENSN